MKKLVGLVLSVITCSTIVGADLVVSANRGVANGDGSIEKPFQKIAHAIRVAKAADVVKIEKGIYREAIFLRNKQFEKTLKIEGIEGETPTISGFDQVTNWTEVSPKLFKTTLKYQPIFVRLNDKIQPISRYPEDGWEQLKLKGDNTFEGFAGNVDVNNSTCYIWTDTNNVFWSLPVINFDDKTNQIQVKVENKWTKIQNNDRFFCYNKAAFIKKSGQWAWEKVNNEFQLYIMAESIEDLKNVEVAGARTVLDFTQVENVEISNLVFEGSMRHGLSILNSKNITIEKVGTYLNKEAGFYLRNSSNLKVEKSNSSLNLFGLICYAASDVELENNNIGYNFEDGINICWDSKNIQLDSNYIHHHSWWGHPDNIQFFRNVDNVVIKNNLLLSALQGVMSEQSINLKFENNVIMGVGANLLILGHKNVNDVEATNNSLLLPGYSSAYLTGKNYKFKNNIYEGARACYAIYGHDENSNYSGEGNIFVNNENKSMPAMFGKEICRDLATYQTLSGTDSDSKAGSFKFANRPETFAVIDHKRIYDCTRDKIYLRTNAVGFEVGDNIEINFDGILRKTTAVNGNEISFEPSLAFRPLQTYGIANWKQNTQNAFDLSSSDITNAGAKINIESYRKSDFDNDGKADTLMQPEFVKDFIANFDGLIPPKSR